MASYIVQEEDGTSKFTLEEGGGSLLTEESSSTGVAATGRSNNGATYAAIGMYYD